MLFLGRLLEAPSCHSEASRKDLRAAMDFFCVTLNEGLTE
jgi:hypothetical protein